MSVRILEGDCREVIKEIPDLSIDCCVTSPPYFGLRDYGHADQMGLEESPDEYIAKMVYVLRQVRRKLKTGGTLWLNIADSYNAAPGQRKNTDLAGEKQNSNSGSIGTSSRSVEGLKPKDMIGIPWMLAFALRTDGWYLRSEIVWAKPNGMPGSQDDRCTSSHEKIFLLSKAPRYWSDFDAIKTPPRESSLVRTAQDVQAQAGSHRANVGAKTNGAMKAVGGLTGTPHNRHVLGDAIPERERHSDKQRGHGRVHAGFNDRWDAMEKAEQQAKPATMRDVWFVPPASFSEAHYAVMPNEIARRCILAGCPEGGTVLDPFGGAGTTGLVADRLQRNAILIELNPANVIMARNRIKRDAPLFAEVS